MPLKPILSMTRDGDNPESMSGENDNGTTSKSPPSEGWTNPCCLMKLQGTVIYSIWWKVLIYIIYSIGIVGLDLVIPMQFTPALVPILGVVTGLLLVFRTNTAYDRYYEGRKIWSQMTHNVRIITRCVWVAIKEIDENSLLEKKSIINFAVAFPIAVKHYLRGEFSYDYEHLKELIGQLQVAKSRSCYGRNGCKGSSSAGIGFPAINYTSHRRGTRKISFRASTLEPEKMTNIPLEIIHCIGIYINSLIERKICDNSVVRTLNFALNGLDENLGGFERILTTPIPLAYSVHLHHALWIHLLSLPFQLVSELKWWTIPAVGFTSYTLLGILAIGWEIENPFGHDFNDLPLDDFCKTIRSEVDEITQSRVPTFEDLFLPCPSDNSPCNVNHRGRASEDSSKTNLEDVRIQVAKGNNKMEGEGYHNGSFAGSKL